MASDGTVSWARLAVEVGQRLASGRTSGNTSSSEAEVERQGRLIVMRACGADGGEWASVSSEPATKRGVAAIDRMTARRLSGEPLQYVLGEWGFRNLDLYLDHRVLIPRPETEIVAGAALAELDRLSGEGDRPVLAADLGTGSGAIGLSLVTEHRDVEVWLTDVSDPALAVARANTAGIGRAASRVRIAVGEWFDALPSERRGDFGVVVSNPPYVAGHETLPSEVIDWEPRGALVSGPSGTEHLTILIREAPSWLHSDGALVLEMAPSQVASMATEARKSFAEVDVVPDLAGRDRAVVARRLRSP